MIAEVVRVFQLAACRPAAPAARLASSPGRRSRARGRKRRARPRGSAPSPWPSRRSSCFAAACLEHLPHRRAALAHRLNEMAQCCASRRCPGCRSVFSSPGACTTRTRDQSASISSATTSGRLVRTPVPISARCATMVTRPYGSMATKTCGSLTVPPRHLAGAGRLGGQRAAGQRADGKHEAHRRPRRLAARTGG